jgi:hypothetical protein
MQEGERRWIRLSHVRDQKLMLLHLEDASCVRKFFPNCDGLLLLVAE